MLLDADPTPVSSIGMSKSRGFGKSESLANSFMMDALRFLLCWILTMESSFGKWCPCFAISMSFLAATASSCTCTADIMPLAKWVINNTCKHDSIAISLVCCCSLWWMPPFLFFLKGPSASMVCTAGWMNTTKALRLSPWGLTDLYVISIWLVPYACLLTVDTQVDTSMVLLWSVSGIAVIGWNFRGHTGRHKYGWDFLDTGTTLVDILVSASVAKEPQVVTCQRFETWKHRVPPEQKPWTHVPGLPHFFLHRWFAMSLRQMARSAKDSVYKKSLVAQLPAEPIKMEKFEVTARWH